MERDVNRQKEKYKKGISVVRDTTIVGQGLVERASRLCGVADYTWTASNLPQTRFRKKKQNTRNGVLARHETRPMKIYDR